MTVSAAALAACFVDVAAAQTPPFHVPPGGYRSPYTPTSPPPVSPPTHGATVNTPVATTASTGRSSQGTSDAPLLPRCVVKIIDEVNVSVQEAGLLTSLEVREGLNVAAEAIVGRVHDEQARMTKLIAEAAYGAALRKSESEIEIQLAQDGVIAAEFAYRNALQANSRASNTISALQMNEYSVAYQKSKRFVEQATHAREIAQLEAAAKKAEVDAADEAVRRRQIVVPLDGQVTEVPVHVGQWVQPGDVIFRIVRLDRLAVDGLLSAAEYLPSEVLNRPVVVEAVLAQGRRAQFAGKITFVHPEIDHRGKFRVKAEIANVAENGQFLLFPGAEVDMTIRLDRPASAPAAQTPLLGRPPGEAERR